MSRNVIVIGAGMGGLTAALRLAQQGVTVQVVEARDIPGGLASGQTFSGFQFDGGPYILLDRPGLEAAFARVGLTLSDHLSLRRLDPVYVVHAEDGTSCRFAADEAQTAADFEREWPGSGEKYRRFVETTLQTYRRLEPMLHVSRPTPFALLRSGAWREAPFLLSSLGAILRRTGLPLPVQNAIGIWTHIAGHDLSTAPSPLAFVPSLLHTVGAYYPIGGIGVIPRVLAAAAEQAGITFRYGACVHSIRTVQGQVTGVELDTGEFLTASAVISNVGGPKTYLELLNAGKSGIENSTLSHLSALPLQSPGVCAYLAIQGMRETPYLSFRLPGGNKLCRLLIRPGVMDNSLEQDGWWPARLMAPMRHADAENLGEKGQRAFLEEMLAESWWRDGVEQFRVLETRIPATWGREFHLYRDSMNPVMTAQFMRQGRMAHRSPYVRGLYLAGSSTHPGQWVSFCALSGLLAAEAFQQDQS